MAKYFCSECNQSADDVICPVCGNLTESLNFDEGSPDGRSDRYDEAVLSRFEDDFEEIDESIPSGVLDDEEAE